MTQNNTLINHLKQRPITRIQAFMLYGITELSSRIGEIEEMGHSIHREKLKKNGKRIVRYHLAASMKKAA